MLKRMLFSILVLGGLFGLEAAVPEKPVGVNVNTITSTSLNVTVTLQPGQYDGIKVELSNSGTVVSGSSEVQLINPTNNSTETFVVQFTGTLIPGRHYNLTIFSRLNGNFGDGFTASMITIPPATPTSPQINSLTPSVIYITVFLPVGDYDSIFVELLYEGIRQSSGFSTRPRFIIGVGSDTTFNFKITPPPTPGSQYSVRVKSKSGLKESNSVDAGMITVAPVPPSSATVTSINTRQIQVTVDFQSGDRTGITVEFYYGMNPVSSGLATINQATDNQFTVPISPDLVPGRQYTVRVRTVSGTESSTAVEATEKNTVPPAPPSSATVTSISAGQIGLTVDFQSGDRTGITVELTDGINPVSTGSATINQATGSQFTVTLSSVLVPGRQYTVRVKTVSGNEFSTAVEATGKITVPPAPPSSATVRSISTQQIELTGNFQSGDRTGITVELSGEGQVSTGSTTINQATDSQFTVTLSSELVPGRQYIVRVKTVSGTESSTAVEATGKNTVPLSDLTTVSVTSISTTHIGLSVFMPKGHYDNITADIVYGQTVVSTGVSARVRFLINPGSEQNFNFPILPHLIPGRQYSVKVTSMSGPVSSNTVTVPASGLTRVAPAQPTSITVSSINTTQITVNVQLPRGDYDGITVELYNGGSTESSGFSSGQVFSVDSSQQKVYTVNLNPELVPGRQYSVRVKSRSGTKVSLTRDAARRSTVRPSTPVAVSMKAITNVSVTLEITFGNGEYTGIMVELHGTHEEKIFKLKSVSYTQLPTKNVTVNGLSLTAGNKYSVKVQARSSGNKVSDKKESSNSLRIVPSTPTIESIEALTGYMSIRVGVKKGPGITPFILVRISRGLDWSRETRLDVQNNGEAEHSFGQLESGNYHVTVKAQSGILNSTTSTTTIPLENPPVSVTVKSRTSRSLELNWRREDLNVKGFRLVVTESTKCLQEIYLNERNYQRNLSNNGCPKSSLVFEKTTTDISYNITQLLPYTLYGLAIYIKTDGIPEKPEPGTLLERTETEVPSKLNITHVSVDGSRNATVCWTRPDPFPGPTEYMITVVDQGDPKLQDVSSVLSGFNQTCKKLSGLEEFWPYSVKVLASTSAGDGPVTESIVFRTKESVPGLVRGFIVASVDNSPLMASVQWQAPAPRDRNANITGFILTIQTTEGGVDDVNNISFPWSKDSTKYSHTINVVPEKKYHFTISARSLSFVGTPYMYEYLPAPQPVENQNTKSDIGLIVGLCCGIICVLILTVVVVFVLRKRRLRTRQKVPTYAPGMNNELSDFGYPTSIPVKLSQFISRIEEMHKNDNNVFSEQYSTLEELSPNLPVTVASQKLNRKKNRNTEVLPFDKTRVKLLAMVGQDGSDYINASYIPGYNFKREYIASQGPLLNTINDFWRMVWEQQIQIILMLTNLKETESEEVYWPKEGFDVSLQYGDIIIETVSTSSLRSCFLREFKVSKGSSVRHVKQFQLVKWPDYGISAGKEMAIFLREFRNNISPEMTEPILVHCSDGAGRTGTLIALDQICQSICDPLAGKDISVDIYNILLTMRHHRARMVQTEAQYVFIHNTLCEILLEKRKNDVHIYSNDAFSDYESLYEIADMDTINENEYDIILKNQPDLPK